MQPLGYDAISPRFASILIFYVHNNTMTLQQTQDPRFGLKNRCLWQKPWHAAVASVIVAMVNCCRLPSSGDLCLLFYDGRNLFVRFQRQRRGGWGWCTCWPAAAGPHRGPTHLSHPGGHDPHYSHRWDILRAMMLTTVIGGSSRGSWSSLQQ